MKPHLPFVTLALLAAACGTHETAPSVVDPTKAELAPPVAEAPKPPKIVGVITSRKSQLITAPFEGNIMKLQARNGREVREGDIIAELDDTKLRHDLEQAKGQLEQAKGIAAKAGALVANARRRATTERRLINSGAAAPEAFRNIQAEASSYGAEGASAAGQIKSAKAMIADLEGQLAKAKIPAPFTGTLSVVKVKEGQAARRGEPIARLFDPKELVIAFAVPTAHKKTVKPNDNIQFVTEDGTVIPATVTGSMDDHDPAIEFTTFEAVIDPTYRIDGIRVGDNGHVRIAGAVR
jgi:RND family efflux transporter MFP subunit